MSGLYCVLPQKTLFSVKITRFGALLYDNKFSFQYFLNFYTPDGGIHPESHPDCTHVLFLCAQVL